MLKYLANLTLTTSESMHKYLTNRHLNLSPIST